MTVMTYELVSNGMAPGAIVPGARIQVRDALWTIQRVIPNEPGNLIEAKGLSGIVRGKEAIFIDLIEPSLKVVSPTDIELVADVSPGFEDTKLFLESAFRTSAPTGPEPLVLGNAAIDDLLFQHVPVRRALTQPRVRLLLADDVGLGKTLEAGLVTAELILRKRADRVLVVTTKATLAQFQKEFWARFSIPLVRLDSVAIQRMRNAIPTNHNPFDQFDKAIISVDTLKNDNQYRTALKNSSRWDLVIIDEAHNVAERKSAAGGASLRANLARLLAAQSDSLLLLTATPHDGSSRSFASLIAMLDRTAVANRDKVTLEEIEPFVIRRFRTTPSVVADLKSRTPERKIEAINFSLSAEEDAAYHIFAELDLDMDVEARGRKAKGLELFRTTLAKAIFSSPAACIATIRNRLDRMARGQAKGTPADVERLEALAAAVAAITPDRFTKYQHLLKLLKNQGWTGSDKRDRLVIFSERIATLAFLREHLMRDCGLEAESIVSVDGSGVEGDVKAQKVFEDFSLFATIFKAAAQVGIRHNPDYNGASQEGIAMSQATIAGGRRMSTARCYLDPVRNRRNLHIEIEALTEGLVLDGKRCTGTAVGRLLLTDCCSAMRDLPLSKRPERAILDSQPPGIGGMSVNISTGVTMKTLTSTALGAVFLAAIAAPSQAQNIVVWRSIEGIAQASNVVGGITGGGQPWSTREGEALVELTSGSVDFEVRGLVLAGGNSIGTPDAVNQVKATLVCGPGSASPTVIDTQLVPLDAQGNAAFSGLFSSSTAGCSPTDVAFLIRTAGGAWIGNGSIRVP
jgi:superfamily II DNA or RNA helicase